MDANKLDFDNVEILQVYIIIQKAIWKPFFKQVAPFDKLEFPIPPNN